MKRSQVALLWLIAAACGCVLHAQSASIDITPVVPEGTDTFHYVLPDSEPGRWTLAFPFPIELRYTDTSSQGPQRQLHLLADRFVAWFEPESGDEEFDPQDAFGAMSRGVRNLQLYGEGNVRMVYGAGNDSVIVRADRVFLDLSRGKVLTYDAEGRASLRDGMILSGRVTEPRIHSGAAGGDDGEGQPVRVGFEIGDTADDTRPDAPGAAPSGDPSPEPAARPRSLPQEQGRRLFARARELRFILTDEVQEAELKGGSISSSSLAVASYSIYAESITLRLTPVRKTAYVTDPALRVLDQPVLRYSVRDYSFDLGSQPPIRQLDLISNRRYGLAFRMYVDAIATYDFLADPEPPFNPFQMGPQIDYFTRRGLGTGLNLDWGGTSAFSRYGRASVRSLYIHDAGDDRQRARELGWFPLEKRDRGRFLGAYSQNFGGGWQLDHLLNYESDRNFRREFYEREYETNQPLDSFGLITRRDGKLNYFLLVEPRVHPWQSKTERLPTLGFDAQRYPVGDFGLQLSSHTEASILRFSPGIDDDREVTYVPRLDSLTWFNLPFELGPLALDPFVGARFTLANHFLHIPEGAERPGLAADGTYPGLRPGDEQDWGILYRFMPLFGVNAQTFFTGTFSDAKVPLLGLDGVRHVIAPFVRYVNMPYNSLDDVPERAFIPMDETDVAGKFHEVRVGLRNRIQTRTGRGDNRRTTDYLELMAEIPIYPDRFRDNAGRRYGDLEVAASWKFAPRFELSGHMFMDVYTGNYERANATLSFGVPFLGRGEIYYRMLKDQHQVVGAQLRLELSETYRINLKQEYDMQSGLLRDTRIEIRRETMEAFSLGFIFVRNAVDGNVGFQFNLSLAIRAPRGGSGLLR